MMTTQQIKEKILSTIANGMDRLIVDMIPRPSYGYAPDGNMMDGTPYGGRPLLASETDGTIINADEIAAHVEAINELVSEGALKIVTGHDINLNPTAHFLTLA